MRASGCTASHPPPIGRGVVEGVTEPLLTSDQGVVLPNEGLEPEEIARLTYVLEIDAGYDAEFNAFIAQMPGARICVVYSNLTWVGKLPAGPLSHRLEQVLQLIRQGLTNKAIGRRLGISHFTVRNHVARLLYIYGAHNRDELIAITEELKEDCTKFSIRP